MAVYSVGGTLNVIFRNVTQCSQHDLLVMLLFRPISASFLPMLSGPAPSGFSADVPLFRVSSGHLPIGAPRRIIYPPVGSQITWWKPINSWVITAYLSFQLD